MAARAEGGRQNRRELIIGLAGFSFGRHPGAFFASFGEPNSNRLLAALHAAAFASFAGAERAAFSSAHGAGDRLAGALTVPAA